MYSETEQKYLLKAIKEFEKNIVVISSEFRVIAANHATLPRTEGDIKNSFCYDVFCKRGEPCENCPVIHMMNYSASDRPGPAQRMSLKKTPCLYSYPIEMDNGDEAFVIMDLDLATMEVMTYQLHRSNAFLRRLILSSVDGIIAADTQGKILILNEAASKVGGYAMDEAINNLTMKDIYPGDGAREVMQKLRSEEYGGRGKLKSCEVDILTKGGELVPISLNAAIVYEDKKEIATVGFFHDLREKKKMEGNLKKTRIQLMQAEKMASLGKMAAGIAHQLNNPLGGISMFTSLIMEEYDLGEELRADMMRIRNNTLRCRDTVKELLEFSRKTSLKMQMCNINRVIEQAFSIVENQTLFQNITIEKNFEERLPLIRADLQQINHLFMNIILNAADAMQGKGVLAVATCAEPNQERVYIEISDTGPGIPDEYLSLIFDPFFTTKEEGKGTGLGLSMAYGIVERHGGTITAMNTRGSGASFLIELPLTPGVIAESREFE